MPLRLSSPILAAGLGASPVICTSTRTMDARVAAFSEPPPQIEVEYFRSGTTEVINRFAAEFEPASRRIDRLSGGRRQRVALARCLAMRPRLRACRRRRRHRRRDRWAPLRGARDAAASGAARGRGLHAVGACEGPAPAPAMPIAVAVHDGWVLTQAARPDRPKPAQAMARSCAGEPPAISAPAATAICAEAGPAPPPAVSRHAVSRSAARSPCPGTPSTRAPSSR